MSLFSARVVLPVAYLHYWSYCYLMKTTNRYDVQVLKAGVWSWCGVVAMPRLRSEARKAMAKMKLEPFWKAMGVEGFRVHQTGFTTKGIAWS